MIPVSAGALKEAAEVLLQAGRIPLYKEVLAAIEQNTQPAKEKAELERQVERLKGEVADLTKRTDQRVAVELRGQAYWLRDPGDKRPGPYCVRCLHKDGDLVPMADYGNGYHGCAVCSATAPTG